MIFVCSSKASVSKLFAQKLLLGMKLLGSDGRQKAFCSIPELSVPVALGYSGTAVTDVWGQPCDRAKPDVVLGVPASRRLGIGKSSIFSDRSALLTRVAWHVSRRDTGVLTDIQVFFCNKEEGRCSSKL